MPVNSYPVEAVKKGKRLLNVNKDIPMYRRFPNSEFVETLPAGKPSPRIVGYLPKGFWEVSREGSDETLYIEDKNISVVPPDTKDESGFFNSTFSWLSDTVTNAGTGIAKKSGFLQEGFKESVSGVKTDFFNISKQIKPILITVAIILGLWLLIKLND